jgi:hypothetical protein
MPLVVDFNQLINSENDVTEHTTIAHCVKLLRLALGCRWPSPHVSQRLSLHHQFRKDERCSYKQEGSRMIMADVGGGGYDENAKKTTAETRKPARRVADRNERV